MKNNTAKAALNQFKMQAASEVGVNLKQGYNGDLTAKQAGSIGGQMVNIIFPMRTLKFTRISRTSRDHLADIILDYTVGFYLDSKQTPIT